jgi:hypothetical protein
MKKKRKIGEVPPGRIPVLDHAGNVRGHLGKRATAASAARFTGHHGAVLRKVKGRDSWAFPK